MDALTVEAAAHGSLVRLRTPEGQLTVQVALPALYNVYNALAALTAARAMGWDVEKSAASLASFGAAFGRMESMTVGDTKVQIVLVKNPAGCDRALEFLADAGEGVLPIFCLNDNIADGTDVSWVWDADYESLFARRRYDRIGVYGVRAHDMRLRLKYAGADDGVIELYPTADALAEAVKNAGRDVYVLPNYTSMLTVRDKLSTLAGGGKFWE
jgi:UDP-N-acetylmuramyl tripeptide synthase